MGRRNQILICASSLLLWALPAAAQVELDGARLSAAGTINAGYSGDFGNLGGSDHGIDVGGSGSLNGFYYNPGFLSFGVQPYYGRDQSSAASGSIFDGSGYNGNVSIFSGSHFPGSINFNQNWNATGLYGIPGTTGLTTKDSNRNFGIAWSELVPGIPSVSAFFSRGAGASSLLGSDAESDSTSDNFGVRSGYRLRGWNVGGSYLHQTLNSNTPAFFEGDVAETSNSSNNNFSFDASHKFPLDGTFGMGFGKSDYSSSYEGATSGTNNGSTDNAFANLSMRLWKFPINATALYESNLQGAFEEQVINGGGTPVQSNLSPESRTLLMSVSTSYHLLPHTNVNGYVSRQEMFIGGQDSGFTQFGANVTFGLLKRFKGLTATIGANDAADRQGNVGIGLVAAVNYTGNFGHWDYSGSFNYNQFVQTIYAISQSSAMAYSGNLHRRLANGLSWSLGAGGSRTAFEQVAGNGSETESVNSSLSWRGYTAAGSFSQSNGTSIVTPTGLVAVPGSLVDNSIAFSGRGYGFGIGGSPVSRLTISASYSQSNSNTTGQSLGPENNSTEAYNGLLTYYFRKLYFNARVIQFRQDISASGTPPSRVTTYYFGISRWFKLF